MTDIMITSTPHIPRGNADLYAMHYGKTRTKSFKGMIMDKVFWDKGEEVNFPKTSGFPTDHCLRYAVKEILDNTLTIEPSDYLLLTAYTTNLGEVNIDYIFNNIVTFKTIYEDASVDYSNLNKELITNKALKRLYAVNFYLKIKGLPYNLPTKYSKKMKQLEQDLILYYKHD